MLFLIKKFHNISEFLPVPISFAFGLIEAHLGNHSQMQNAP